MWSEGTAILRCSLLGLKRSSVPGPERLRVLGHVYKPTALCTEQGAKSWSHQVAGTLRDFKPVFESESQHYLPVKWK